MPGFLFGKAINTESFISAQQTLTTSKSDLRKLGETWDYSGIFRKKEVEANLTKPEKEVFHNFLRKMRELGVIESDLEHGRGAYRFVNEMYPLYISIESDRFRED